MSRHHALLLPAVALALLSPAFASDSNYTYLALGDSVAFGLDIRLFVPGQPPPSPDAFTGYPEIVASAERLLTSKKEVNAACPGETSASFLDTSVPDYGCNSPAGPGEPPFKTSVGLHTNYTGSQMNFAVSQLSTNRHVNMVTLGIGGNDILLLLRNCTGQPQTCVSGQLPGVLQAYAQNLTRILTGIRSDANYKGTLILVKYYSPSPDLNQIAQALNSTMATVGSGFGVRFADGYTAFQLASVFYGGDPCAAGLLVRLSPTTCDVHPSRNGQNLLALTVELALAGIQ